MNADWTNTTPADLLRSHLNRKPPTARAYRYDLIALANALGIVDIDPANDEALATIVEAVVDSSRGAAQRRLDDYVAMMKADGVPLNTMRRRVASTMSLLAMAHRYDVVAWSIKRPGRLPAAGPVRDTSGPGREAVEAMMAICRSRDDAKGDRDLAIMSLLYYQALRRGEIVSIRVSDYNAEAATVAVQAKGRIGRVVIPLTDSTDEAIDAWLRVRGRSRGAMFTTCCRAAVAAGKQTPLTGDGLYHVVRDLGERVGVTARPHGIRHTAASEVIRLTNGNLRLAMALTRHTNPATLMYYDDAVQNLHRRAALILDRGRPVFSSASR